MRSVEIFCTQSTPSCPRKEPTDSAPQPTRSSSPELCPSLARSSSTISPSSSFFFNGSLLGYGAWIYVCSDSQFNLLSRSAKILEKSAFSGPQSEIAGAVWATRMEQKISQELYNVSLSNHRRLGNNPENDCKKQSCLPPCVLWNQTHGDCLCVLSSRLVLVSWTLQPSWPADQDRFHLWSGQV